ncbi:rod-binding protein [Desulfurivibrio alkaliphilus]|uniref:Flagellar protein FlgJ-like protein n=1 Tax=Desulfurivibrio alkaliphilus (strain DSM 19089 / UNIQEM U267 / AHT2) TaxID=589865 RepID=D6Z725_DESAT|nr:rod-binding protein [Desulfurivibrio alkaliphilus]ADH87012.1 Flagellar protein FlgJ-like protein [Desulfurivibrio alkaliphilus AHT 2]
MEINSLTGGPFKPATATSDKEGNPQLRQACAEFEAIILQKFLSMARQTGPQSDLLGGGHAEEMYQSLHDQELARHLASGKGMGFGEMLYRQINQQHYR